MVVKSKQASYVLLGLSTVLFGCGGENSGLPSQKPSSESSANVFEIVVTPDNVSTYLPEQYKAIGKYDDGSTADITHLVNWSTVTPDIASFNQAGLAAPIQIGSTQVTASLDGITSNEVTLNVIESFVCGHVIGFEIDKEANGGVDNADATNATGKCLKVREIVDSNDGKTKWFTSTPTASLLSELGYTAQDTPDNSGDTYASSMVLNIGLAPVDGDFAYFRQDGDGVVLPGTGNDAQAGVNGQFDRWCQKLATINFAGQSNWRRPDQSELQELYSFNNPTSDGMYPRFGWPTVFNYLSSTVNGSTFNAIGLSAGAIGSPSADLSNSASCVSSF
ncbi:hypothetical protein AB2S62_08135 [Vibrio sp. NTOU-M3]|uniref:hypothetical protein n=1 Tax=Vibrio sp. NTOU-M3 TaxID=3234954 RepID=UPI00349FBE8C